MFTTIRNAVRRSRLPKRDPHAIKFEQFNVGDEMIFAARNGYDTVEFAMTKDDARFLEDYQALRKKLWDTWGHSGTGLAALRKLWQHEDAEGFYLQNPDRVKDKTIQLYRSITAQFKSGNLVFSWQTRYLHELLEPPAVSLGSRLKYKQEGQNRVEVNWDRQGQMQTIVDMDGKAAETFAGDTALKEHILAAIGKAAGERKPGVLVHTMKFDEPCNTNGGHVPERGLIEAGDTFFDNIHSEQSMLARGIARWALTEEMRAYFSFPQGANGPCEVSIYWNSNKNHF